MLAIPAFEKPIDSLNQLAGAQERGYVIGTTRDSSFEETLKVRGGKETEREKGGALKVSVFI